MKNRESSCVNNQFLCIHGMLGILQGAHNRMKITTYSIKPKMILTNVDGILGVAANFPFKDAISHGSCAIKHTITLNFIVRNPIRKNHTNILFSLMTGRDTNQLLVNFTLTAVCYFRCIN